MGPTNPNEQPSSHDRPLRRYYLGGFVTVLVQLIIIMYCYLVWFICLNSFPADDSVLFGSRGGLTGLLLSGFYKVFLVLIYLLMNSKLLRQA
jgi:hypothetical protein